VMFTVICHLLIGDVDALQPQNESSFEILSHWHPNLTINLIDDHTHWVRGMVPSPLDECKCLLSRNYHVYF